MRASLPRWVERVGTILTFLLLVGGLGILWLTGVSSIRHLVANLIGSYFMLWGLVLLVVKGSRAEMTTRFALSSMALGAALLCLEATAFIGRIDYRLLFGVPIEQARWQRPYRAFDPELGWVIQPHARFSGTAQGGIATMLCLDGPAFRYDARFDRHGFRNDVDLHAADIAVIGDSFVEAVETANDRILTTVLGRLTESTVANLGRGAYGPQQQLIVLKRYALPLRPKVVVWAFFEGNDLHDVKNYDVMMSALRRGEVGVSPSAYERSFVVSALGGLFRFIRGCRPAPDSGLSSGLFQTVKGQSVEMYFQLRNDQWTPTYERALGKVREVFQEAYEHTEGQGAALVVAFIPLSFRVYKDVVECADRSRCAEWAFNDLPQRLERVVAEVSDRIRYIDLTPQFVDEAKRGRLLYLPDDIHWSAEGHRVAAEAIADSIGPLLRRQQR